jgi:hypothetical protein
MLQLKSVTSKLSDFDRDRSAWRPLRRRALAASMHFLGSAGLVGLVCVPLLQLWFPSPYAEALGGLELLALLLAVDVVLGPLLTFVAAAPGKPGRVLAKDLAVIVALQLGAFGYGLYTMAVARPIGLVFEVDHMRVVCAADIDPNLLRDAPAEMKQLSWTGPRVFAAIKPTDGKQLLEAVEYGLAGFDLAMLPKHWRPYDGVQQAAAWRVATPAAGLIAQRTRASAQIRRVATSAGASVEQLRVLPIRMRKSDSWVALLAEPDSRIVGLVDLNEAQ